MYFKFDWLNLKPGDILLSRSKGLKAAIIAKATDGHFSHAMLYVGGSIIHADGEGVYSKNPQRIYAKNRADLAVLRVKEKITGIDLAKICDAARSEVGKLYDLKGAVYSIASGENRSTENRQFCSKLVADAFGSVLINFGKSSEKITPNDFCRSDLLELREELILPMDDDEFAFAISPDYNLDLQEETFCFLAKAREFARKKNVPIGTINDVINYLIAHPEDDEAFCKMIDETRYFGFTNIDKEKNPYRYDLRLFKEKLLGLDAGDRAGFLQKETVGLEEEIRHRLQSYLWSILALAEKDLSFFRKHHELNKELYLNVSSRAHVLNLFPRYQALVRTLLSKEAGRTA